VTYDIIADFTTRRYHSTDLAQWYRFAEISWFWNWSVTRDEPLQEQPQCKRRKEETATVNLLVDSDDEQDGAARQSLRMDRQLRQMTALRPCRQN